MYTKNAEPNICLINCNIKAHRDINMLVSPQGFNTMHISDKEFGQKNFAVTPVAFLIDVVAKTKMVASAMLDKVVDSIQKKFGFLVPVIAMVSESCGHKQVLFDRGVLDYVSYPLIPAELLHRLNCLKHLLTFRQDAGLNNLGNKKARLASEAVEILRARLSENITLAELSTTLSTNRNTLAEAFKTHMNTSIFNWLREQRMLKGAQLLAETSLSVVQVAERVGYTDGNNFSTAFKKQFNMSPLNYRKARQCSATALYGKNNINRLSL
ncbi:L-rhamnose operon regulatory protein RhaS [Vibrio spartinae]|uniref:L-rhamnose operon regulatory protein RhaS n=2 Tax=Vibrio spartinae TaxID=1918945 RepID=A0ABX6QZQ5_9VIBR|nr:L-rhamnose operon regulatory protein RhaS [Vibrio spartinae]